MRLPRAALGALVLATGIILPTSATLAASSPTLDVELTGLAPMVPKPTDTLTISGELTNTGQVSIPDAQVRLRVVTTPLLGRSDITSIVSGNTGVQGDLVTPTVADQPRRLDPGGQVAWHISVPFADLPLGGAGVYVLVVEAVGTVDSNFGQLGVTRTFLPWVPVPSQVQPSHLVWLWPVTAPPTGGPDGIFVTDEVGQQFAPTGRLGRILALGTSAPSVVTWVVDPQVLEAAGAMSHGYRFDSGSQVSEGSGTAAASSWLASATSVLSGAEVYALPYGLPDADALVHAGLDRDVASTITQGTALLTARLGSAPTSTLFWPMAGISDRRTLDVVQGAGVPAVVLSDTTLATAATQPYTSTGLAQLSTVSGSLDAVLADSGLSAALAMPTSTPAQILAARQRFAAETAMVTFEDPGRPRTVVAAPALDWSPNSQLVGQLLVMAGTAPWISPTTLTALLAAGPDNSPRTRTEYSASDRSAELPGTAIGDLLGDQHSLDALSGVLTSAATVTQGYSKAILRAESSWWRLDPDTGAALRTRIADSLNSKISQVRIVSHGTITLSGINGKIPLTIANDFDQPVVVGLVLHANPAPRLKAAAIAPFTIPPHRKISVEVTAQLAGSAPLAVMAQLVSANGESLGQPVRLALRSTAYARAAKYVVVAAFAAMVLLLAANFVRRLRRRT